MNSGIIKIFFLWAIIVLASLSYNILPCYANDCLSPKSVTDEYADQFPGTPKTYQTLWNELLKGIKEGDYLNNMSVIQCFYNIALNPDKWMNQTISDWEKDYLINVSNLSANELAEEFINLFPSPNPNNLKSIRNKKDLRKVASWFEGESKFSDILLNLLASLSYNSEVPVKQLWILREWVYRHWDDKPKPKSKAFFNKSSEQEIPYNPEDYKKERVGIAFSMFNHGKIAKWNVSILMSVIMNKFNDLLRNTFFISPDTRKLIEANATLFKELLNIKNDMLDITYNAEYGYNMIIDNFKVNQNVDDALKSCSRLLKEFNQLYERYMAVMKKLNDLNDQETKNKLREHMEHLNEVFQILLNRFPNAALKNSETAYVPKEFEGLSEMFEEIKKDAKSSHVESKIPNLHIMDDRRLKIFLYKTDRIAIQSFINDMAMKVAFERFFSNAIHLGMDNMYVSFTVNNQDQLEIVIEDDGDGIEDKMLEYSPDDNRQLLFCLGKTTRKSSGTGMALAWNTIRLFGGNIHAEKSQLFGGAKFTITLPINSPLNETGLPLNESIINEAA